jgi:hypothetical protein
MQLALYDEALYTERRIAHHPRRHETRSPEGRRGEDTAKPMCAACRAREARYGFGDVADPQVDRPRTLCFECFRMELDRRQAVSDQLARGWNAEQAALPLTALRDGAKYDELRKRRGRAQIAARRALALR